MVAIDQLARGSTVALLVVMGVVIFRHSPRAIVTWAACGLFASIAAYLIVSSPRYVAWPPADMLLRATGLAAPATFLLFTRAFFGDDDRLNGWMAAALVTLVAIGFGRPNIVPEVVYASSSAILVAWALWQVVRGLASDLVEPRRRARAAFAIVVGVEILTILAAEVWLRGTPAPLELEVVKSVLALLLTAGFATWLLAPRIDLLAQAPLAPTPPAMVVSTVPPDADARIRDRLVTLVSGEQLYRQEGLSIGTLAQRLDLPEYRVRRIINQQLGYRNFNAFLNELRVAEACRILADPAHERLPIFNLAMDLGYGSLGPFNRAFRAKTGRTPTEYRRIGLAQGGEAPNHPPTSENVRRSTN